MSWWQNPGLPGISIDPSSVRLPVELELVPEMVLATIDLMQVRVGDREINCWTYQSRGLCDLGQKEILFALKQDDGQSPGSFPGAPLDFFKNIAEYVLKGEYLDAGSITTFGDSGFLSGRFRAIGYVQPPAIAEACPPEKTLWALLLTANELEAARIGGLSRIMALMGKRDLYFPCPLWNDLQRDDSVSDDMLLAMNRSPMSQFPRMPLHSVTASRMENKVDCLIPTSARASLSQLRDLDEEMPMAILTGIDGAADGFLVWQKDEKAPLAITAPGFPGDRLGGSFLCFVPDQDHDLGLISDDGFAFSLTAQSWRKIRQALVEGKPCAVAATNPGLDLEIQWFDDPDMEILSTKREQRQHFEVGEDPLCVNREKSSVPARATRVELRTHEPDVARALDPAVLSAYIQRLEDVVRDHFFYQGPSEGFDLLLECTLSPGDHAEFRISSKPVMEADDENDAIDRLSLTFAPSLREGIVEFAMEFAVWGGAGALSGDTE